MYASALERAATNLETYIYYHSSNFTDISPLFWEGAYHMSELPLTFGTRGYFHGNASSFETEASISM